MRAEIVTYRAYRDSDYSDCEALVEKAWEFEKNFQPRELAALFKYLYTMGSVAMSNYCRVAECNNEVVGLIFGCNERVPLPKHKLNKLSSKLIILLRLLFMRAMTLQVKFSLIKSMGIHEKNRTALLERGKSEIVLFIVHPAFHGKGIGKKLFNGFRSFCEKAQVKSIIVETNKLGAAYNFTDDIFFAWK